MMKARDKDESRTAVTKDKQARTRELLGLPVSDLINLLGNQMREGEMVDTAASPTANSPMQRIRIFLSYARADRQRVTAIFDQLHSDGFDPWMDVKCIQPGQKWRKAIENAIRDAHFFLLFLSEQSVNRRGFLQREIRIALDNLLELLDDDIYFIPLRLESCMLPPSLSEYQALDLFDPDAYERLVFALKESYRRRFQKGRCE